MIETHLPPPVDLSALFRRATTALGARVAGALATLGLSTREYVVLWRAAECPRTQVEVAELASLDKTTMVVTLDGLEAAGLAYRLVSPTDRRARVVVVTPAGLGTLEQAHAAVAAVYTDVLAQLGPDGATALVHALTALVEGPLAGEPPATSRRAVPATD